MIEFTMNTKQITKEIQAKAKAVDEAARISLVKGTEQRVAKLSFDDIETIPFAKSDMARIVMNTEQFEKSAFSIESILANEKAGLVDDTLDVLSEELKGVFK